VSTSKVNEEITTKNFLKSTTLQTKPVVAWDFYTEIYTSNHGKLKNRPTNP
jgi:hypothetical protein